MISSNISHFQVSLCLINQSCPTESVGVMGMSCYCLLYRHFSPFFIFFLFSFCLTFVVTRDLRQEANTLLWRTNSAPWITNIGTGSQFASLLWLVRLKQISQLSSGETCHIPRNSRLVITNYYFFFCILEISFEDFILAHFKFFIWSFWVGPQKVIGLLFAYFDYFYE